MKYLFFRQFFDAQTRFVFQKEAPRGEQRVEIPGLPSVEPSNAKARANLLEASGHLDLTQLPSLNEDDKKEIEDVSKQTKKLLDALDKTIKLLENDDKSVDTELKKALVSMVRTTVSTVTGKLELDPAKVNKANVENVLQDLGKTFKTVDYNQSSGALDITGFKTQVTIHGAPYDGIYTRGAKNVLSVKQNLFQEQGGPEAIVEGKGEDGDEEPAGFSPLDQPQVPYGLANVGLQYKKGPLGVSATMGSYGRGFGLKAQLLGDLEAYGGVYQGAGSMVGLSRNFRGGSYVDMQVFPGATAKPGDSSWYLTYGFPSAFLEKKYGIKSLEVGAYAGTSGPQLTGFDAPKPPTGWRAGLTIGGRF